MSGALFCIAERIYEDVILYGSAKTARHGGSKPPPYGSVEIVHHGYGCI